MEIGSLIKSLRVQHGLSQQDLALRAGTSRVNVSRIENNACDSSYTLIRSLLRALSCDLEVRPLLFNQDPVSAN